MEAFGKFCLSIVIGASCVFIRSFAIVKLWAWFVVPEFHAAPLIWSTAFGLAILVSVFVNVEMPERSAKEDYAALAIRTATTGVAGPLVALGTGWLLK